VLLQGTSVEKSLCKAVALTNNESLTANFPANTRFETLFANIQVANGKATLNPLRAELPGIALTGSGNYDLVKQSFVAAFKGRLSEKLEQLDHACRVSKRLTAIDWPVNCAGSVGTEPASWCRVDTVKIMQDLAVNEGLDKLKKKAGKLFEKLFNGGD
jgi:AsmA protein